MMHVKHMICAILLVNVAGTYGRDFQEDFTDRADGVGAMYNKGPTDQTQRVADALNTLAKSEELKKSAKKCWDEIFKLSGDQSKRFMRAFMDEIRPEDAEGLLPLMDATIDLFKEYREFSSKSSLLSVEEQTVFQVALQTKVSLVLFYAAPYLDALKMRKESFEESAQESVATDPDNAYVLDKLVLLLAEARASVAQKAQQS